MDFARPDALWLLLLVPAAALLFQWAARKRTEALRLFFGAGDVGPAFAPLARRRRVRAALVVAALALLIVALAGPRYGTALREGRQESLDLLVALDVSNSMRAQDVRPNRLDRARMEIGRLAALRRGDRLGLVVFAGDAFLQCPLTSDTRAFRLFLDAAGPGLVATQGTDFERMLEVALRAFEAGAPSERDVPVRPRALLIVSDGEDHEGSYGGMADALREAGVETFALGVGTEEGGPIPLYRAGRLIGYKTDEAGQEVTTRYEAAALREVAGRDRVFRLGRDGVEEINRRLERMDRAVLGTDRYEAYAERFMWPLGLALLLLVAERLVAARPLRRDA